MTIGPNTGNMSQDRTPTPSPTQEYWISGYGLSRPIVLGQLNYFLGPSATVRPYTFQGREGYRIVGSKLTDSQLADLKRQSKEYERQMTIRMSGRSVIGEGQPEDIDINTIVLVSPARKVPNYNSSYRRIR